MTCPMPMLESIQWQFHGNGKATNEGDVVVIQHGSSATTNEKLSLGLHEDESSSWQASLERVGPVASVKGDAYVDGAEGPAILTFDMPEREDHPLESVNLQLKMRLGPGADAQYRTHLLDIQIHLSLVPMCDNKIKMDDAWASADQGKANVSVRSQVFSALFSETGRFESHPLAKIRFVELSRSQNILDRMLSNISFFAGQAVWWFHASSREVVSLACITECC